ncbi:MAG: 2OG-Fe(II) oxygenase family protein [Acidiferrobacterales bacterium]|nr:2OG-Fe(II) oxygenase family protein [Acidiferrobacterales bacterium]
MHVSEQDGFHLLWPLLFMQRTLPGYEHANIEFERIILEREATNRDLTTDYLEESLFALKNPAIDWLRQCIHKSTIDYCRRAGIDYPIDWTLQGWANVNRLGDYHDPHNHPYAYLSGTYYVRVPNSRVPLRSRADVRPGCITFYDPRGAVNMTAIKGDPQIEPEFTVLPKPGMILMWPAFVMHYVHPNLSEEPRISVSFNLIVKNPTDYLPQQQTRES